MIQSSVDTFVEIPVIVSGLNLSTYCVPWTHFTKSLGSHNPNFFKNTCSFMNKNYRIKLQFCTCHDSSAVMACAQLQPDCINIFHARATCFYKIWIMNVCEMVPRLQLHMSNDASHTAAQGVPELKSLSKLFALTSLMISNFQFTCWTRFTKEEFFN